MNYVSRKISLFFTKKTGFIINYNSYEKVSYFLKQKTRSFDLIEHKYFTNLRKQYLTSKKYNILLLLKIMFFRIIRI